MIPLSGYYCGTDMSKEMIRCARERNQYSGKKYDFLEYGFEEFCALTKETLPCRFDRLWICGVMMYINDEILLKGMSQLLDKIDERARVYLTETIALTERLTLDEFYSESKGLGKKEDGRLSPISPRGQSGREGLVFS